MQDYKLVSLGDIRPDPNQPRKHVNQTDMEELAQSIIQKGVFQPILLRPCSGTIPFMLVCGERRYKASLMAQVAKKEIQDIPAVIRDMSDEEALELQIIENLQRKDVHPLEEAFAFASMVQKKQLDIKEISFRVGKSAGYVAQRIKLTELIKPFQDLLFADKMPFAQAQEICRFATDIQKEIYKQCKVPADWEKKPNWKLEKSNMWFISNHQHNLAQASFKTEDPDLYPEMGKCGNCPFNSAANKLEFPDMPNKRICHNAGCYSIKTKRSYENQIKAVIEQPDMLFVNASYYPDTEGKGKIKAIQESGHKVLNTENYNLLEEPEHPGTLEEFVEDTHWLNEENTQEEKQASYDRELKRYDEAQAKYDQQKLIAQKAFIVTGTGEGKIIDVILKGKDGLQEGNPVTAIDLQIAELESKERRAKELDREKIMKAMQVEMAEKYVLRKSNLVVIEAIAQIMIMVSKASQATQDRIRELLQMKKSSGWLDRMQVLNALHNLATNKEPFTGIYPFDIFNELQRRLIYDNLYSDSTLDYEKNWEPAVMYSLTNAFEGTSQFVEQQQAKALKRQNKVADRIAELQAKKEELQKPVQPEPPVIPITKKKKVKALSVKEELS